MDVYAMIQDKILGELAKGNIPWLKPWKSKIATSYVTKKPYSLINQFLLGGNGGEWLTFNQCQSLGGHIKSGAKSRFVVFWKLLKHKEIINEEEVEKTIPYLRYYNVFNVEDCEGITPHTAPAEEFNENLTAETVFTSYTERECIKVNFGGNSAYYAPDEDSINLPDKESFYNSCEFYGTAFHEAAHSTGAESRLNRNIKNRFGTAEYAKEELVAEMGSAYILGNLGLDTKATVKNSAAYIQSWSKAIKEDKYLVVSACSKAEKACKYILGELPEDAEEVEG